MEKGIPCKWKSKESQSSNIYIRQNDFKMKTITRDKDFYYLIMRGSNQEEHRTIIYTYASNIESPKYIRQILT